MTYAFEEEEALTVGYYNTFVVKIWCDDQEEMIRGHIQHVSSQEHTYFRDIEQMTDFMSSRLSSPLNNSLNGNGIHDEGGR